MIVVKAIIIALGAILLAPGAQAQRLDFGLYASDDSLLGQTATRFSRLVQQSSGGRVELNIISDFSIGSPRTMLEMVQRGDIGLTLASVGYLRSMAPKMDILQLPFLFKNHDEVNRILDARNEIGRQLLDGLDRKGKRGFSSKLNGEYRIRKGSSMLIAIMVRIMIQSWVDRVSVEDIPMTRRQWILITLALAVVHLVLTNFLIMPTSMDILFSRFDGNDYNSPWDPLLVGLYFLLNFPYFLMKYSFPQLHTVPPELTYSLLWIGNSLVWGLIGCWLISKLPMFKEQDLPE